MLLGVVLLAAVLRLAAIDHDLPYVYHPDEPAIIQISREMFASGDLNPHFFDYPSLIFYGNAAVYAPLYLKGWLSGEFRNPADILSLDFLAMGTAKAPQPEAILLNRGLSLAAGLGTVVLLYFIGHILYANSSIGLVAALLLAVSPNHVYQSRIVTPDAMTTFFVVLTFLTAALIFRHGKTLSYILAGASLGLAAGTKYNGATIALTIPLAHFLRYGLRGWRDTRLLVAAGVSVLVFLLTTPYAILDYPAFSAALRGVGTHYEGGHAGMEGDTLRWYLSFLWTTTTLAPVLAVIEIIRGLWQRSRPTLLLAAFPVFYFIFICRFDVRNDRTILPIVPFVFLLAAVVLVDLYTWARQSSKPAARAAAPVALVALLVATVGYPLISTVRDNRLMARVRSQEMAADWIAQNLESNARVAIGPYSPFLDPRNFEVVSFDGLIDQPAQWYATEGFDYLIASSGMYGRFYLDPIRYADEAHRYDLLFASYTLVKSFNDGLNEIRIYRVR